MKILGIFWYYKPANMYGGPISSTAAILEGLALEGADVTVYTTNANGRERLDVPLNTIVNVEGVNVIYLPVSWDLFTINYSRQLAKMILSRINNFDLIVSGILWHPLLVDVIQTACLKAKVPYVVFLFGQLMPWAMRQKRLKKRLFLSFFGRRYLNHASALQCTSSAERESVKQLGLSTPTIFIPYIINKSKLSNFPVRGSLRFELGIKEKDIVLLFLARLHHVKRPELPLEVLIKLRRPDIHLIYAGPDEEGYQEQLQKQSQKAGFSDHVHFLGKIDDVGVQQALSDADLLIMPSEQENFGMSAAEALMSGLPILTSKYVPVGVQAAEIGAGRISELSVESFTYELQDLLQNPEQLKAMGNIGKEFAVQYYDTSKIGRFYSQYKDIIFHSKMSQ